MGGIGLFLLLRYYRLGFLAALTVAFGLGAVSYMFWKAGLPLLPSSVVRKHSIASQVVEGKKLLDPIFRLIDKYEATFCLNDYASRWMIMFNFTLFILILAVFFLKGDLKRYRTFWIVSGIILIMHQLFGFYNSMGRHEVYAVASMLMSLFSILPRMKKFLYSKILEVFLTVLMLIIAFPYLHKVITTPLASADIYTQQHQMHRFATEFFPHPVAINDLGWVSFRNHSYVLDLFGLGSYEITRMYTQEGWNPKEVQKIAQKHGVVYAMIYRHWFEVLPDDWCLMGILKNKRIISGGHLVHFYLLKPEYRQEMQEALKKWAKTLPDGTKFYPVDCLPDSQRHTIEAEIR